MGAIWFDRKFRSKISTQNLAKNGTFSEDLSIVNYHRMSPSSTFILPFIARFRILDHIFWKSDAKKWKFSIFECYLSQGCPGAGISGFAGWVTFFEYFSIEFFTLCDNFNFTFLCQFFKISFYFIRFKFWVEIPYLCDNVWQL